MKNSNRHSISKFDEHSELGYWARELRITAEEYKAALNGSGLSQGVIDYLKNINQL